MRRWICEKYEDVCWRIGHYAWYIREKHTRPWRIWCRHRRSFMASQKWMLQDPRFPTLKRVWFLYLFWVGYFVGNFLKLYASDALRIAAKACCKLGDALFGGNRTEQFLEARKRRLAELKGQNRQIAETHRQQGETCFQLRLRHEAQTNPHFVATHHTHQDRH